MKQTHKQKDAIIERLQQSLNRGYSERYALQREKDDLVSKVSHLEYQRDVLIKALADAQGPAAIVRAPFGQTSPATY